MNSFIVEQNDVIFVNVSAFGRQITNVTLSGKSSVEELMASLRLQLANLDGLLTLNLRNRSQGTSTKVVLRLRKSSGSFLRAQMKGDAA
jgi:hypothetical protein